MDRQGSTRTWDVLWLLLWGVASTTWCITASARLSATFDEPTYVRLGLESWRTGTSRRLLDLGTMPLPVHAQTLPLYIWERARGTPFDVDQDFDRMLHIARVAALPFWWLLLVYGYLIGRQIAGPWGSRLAVAFLACEPTLLAHASLATTDVAVTGCLLAFFYHFQTGRGHRWGRRVALPSLCFAAALLAKASALTFGLVGMAALQVVGATNAAQAGSGSRLRIGLRALFSRPFRRDVAQLVSIALAVVLIYCGSDWEPSPSFVNWANGLPEGKARTVMSWFAEHLCIFSNGLVAIVRQVRHNIQGHGVYLLGHTARRAIWYYFPLALTIKIALPLLLLPPLLLLAWPRALRNWACTVALALLVCSLGCRVQTGVRLILPLIAVAAVGLAAALTTACQQLSGGRAQALLRGAAILAGLWMATSSTRCWPNGLCFVNEAWGGTEGGYRLVADSNYDWGQGLDELAGWRQRHGITRLAVLYYGTDPGLDRRGLVRIENTGCAGEAASLAIERALRGQTVAVSTSILFGAARELDWLGPWIKTLEGRQPVDRTSTFFIYRFPDSRAPGPATIAAR